MTRTRSISFAEFARFLKGLGYSQKHAEAAWIFHRRTKDLLVFRLYGDEETVSEGDLRSTRLFLDYRGLLAAEEFDTFVQKASVQA